MVIIHNAGDLSSFVSSFGFAEIKEETIKFVPEKTNETMSVYLDFNSGIYLIERFDYPRTEDQKKKAIERAMKRLGESDYKFYSSNCELFATWTMTRAGECEQIENAGQLKIVAADMADSTICNYRSAGIKTVIDKGLQATIIGTESVKKISTLIVDSTSSATSNVVAGAVASAVAAPIEALSCIHSISSLHDKKTDKQIDQRTFEREVTKNISGSLASYGGSVGGAVCGQMLIPVPIVGGVVGGTVGSLVGRLSGSVVSGVLYDIWGKDFLKRTMRNIGENIGLVEPLLLKSVE
ncbi:Hypothetical predicted protein [Mytilus galloprovincialis]|nr:Hypothetical predicted protein [Mytilus galloprovincialis]